MDIHCGMQFEAKAEPAATIFEDRTSLLTYYGIQAAEFRMRHDAIFSQIKHYNWLVSLLLASPISLLVGHQWDTARRLLPYFVPIQLIGCLFSVVAFFVVRREYLFFSECEGRLLYLERELGLAARPGFLDVRLSKASEPDFTVAKYREQEQPLGTFWPPKARIRTLFLAEFLVFGLVGLAEVIISLSLLFR